MKEFIIKEILILCFSEEEISELAFRKLLDKDRFFIIFADAKVLFNLIYSDEYRKLVSGKLIIPSSKIFGFVAKLLFGVSDVSVAKESSTIFKVIKNISDYYYRVAVIASSDKMASKFKNNLKLSFPEMKLNIMGLSKILSKHKHKERIEMLKKLEPNLIIFDTASFKFIRFINKNKELFEDASIIMSSRGVELISGVRNILGSIIEATKRFFSWVFVVLWVLKEKILMIFSKKKREKYAKGYRV